MYSAPKHAAAISEETAAWLEYEAWEDKHGTYDGFVPSNPAAFFRAREMDLRDRRNTCAPNSSDYIDLSRELKQLQSLGDVLFLLLVPFLPTPFNLCPTTEYLHSSGKL